MIQVLLSQIILHVSFSRNLHCNNKQNVLVTASGTGILDFILRKNRLAKFLTNKINSGQHNIYGYGTEILKQFNWVAPFK